MKLNLKEQLNKIEMGSEKFKRIFVIFIFVIALSLLVTTISILIDLDLEETNNAKLLTMSKKQDLIEDMSVSKSKALAISEILSEKETKEEVYDFLSTLYLKDEFDNVSIVRYFIDDKLYSYNGDEFLLDDPSKEINKNKGESTFLGFYNDETVVNGHMSMMGYYIPIKDPKYVHAVTIYFTRNEVDKLFNSTEDEEGYTLLVSKSGEIISGKEEIGEGNFLDYLSSKIDQKKVEQIKLSLENEIDEVIKATINGKDYMISVGSNKEQFKEFSVVGMYLVSSLGNNGIPVHYILLAIILLLSFIFVGIFIYLEIKKRNVEKKFHKSSTTDISLNCLNRNGFEKEAGKVLENNKTSKFFVIVFEIGHFKYIKDNYGENEINGLLKYIRDISIKNLELEESFGSMEQGYFLFMLHAKDRDALIERLKIHAYLCGKYKGNRKYDVLLRYGIFEAVRDVSIVQMIEYAIEANNSISRGTIQNTSIRFNFYNDEVRKLRILHEEMELHMEDAIKNEEFQVFYQPKYNLNENKQDGAEALVRWYDKKTGEYVRPALFMGLFESNGFVVKLDKYVYTKVCEYIKYAFTNGIPVYPISVNVSRVTAVQEDFVEFYSQIKKKYNIKDKFITIEFTESFAYEDYDNLLRITKDLHRNGFKCSIDDFGSGSSSYQILKELPMDEIKLDKFFLQEGMSIERDNYVYESITELGSKLGMKVTQEGAETKEELLKLRNVKCDVVQGYYYSYPLPLNDYIQFTKTSKEHNLE